MSASNQKVVEVEDDKTQTNQGTESDHEGGKEDKDGDQSDAGSVADVSSPRSREGWRDCASSRFGIAGHFMAAHQALVDQTWTQAKFLEVALPEEQSATTPSILLKARRHAKATGERAVEDLRCPFRSSLSLSQVRQCVRGSYQSFPVLP